MSSVSLHRIVCWRLVLKHSISAWCREGKWYIYIISPPDITRKWNVSVPTSSKLFDGETPNSWIYNFKIFELMDILLLPKQLFVLLRPETVENTNVITVISFKNSIIVSFEKYNSIINSGTLCHQMIQRFLRPRWRSALSTAVQQWQ